MKKILITGGNGYIAKNIKEKFGEKYDLTVIGRRELDLTNPFFMAKWFERKHFDVVIHTAAVGGSRLKPETQSTLDQNLSMYYNLQWNHYHYDKFISFGSGAEIFQQNTLYGLSKKIIANSIQENDKFHNIRIFGVFDHNELETRFIKSSIIKYLKKEPILIHNDKIMDFFYMEDLVNLVEYFVLNDAPKEINCSYQKKYTLKNIADMINKLSDYKVEVQIENKEKFDFYCANQFQIPIDLVGLENGIKKTYEKLKNSY
jgi:UDP-glucose 4-epimerase